MTTVTIMMEPGIEYAETTEEAFFCPNLQPLGMNGPCGMRGAIVKLDQAQEQMTTAPAKTHCPICGENHSIFPLIDDPRRKAE